MLLSYLNNFWLLGKVRSSLRTNLGSQSTKWGTSHHRDFVCFHKSKCICLGVVRVQLELIVQWHVTSVGQYISRKLNVEVRKTYA